MRKIKRRIKLKENIISDFMNNNKIILIIILIFIVFIYIFIKINNQILPIMSKRINTDITRLTIDYINDAIKENFNNNKINADDIITAVKNKNDEIVAIDFNTNNINNMMVSITDKLQNDMKNLNNLQNKYILKEGNVYYVPAGSVTNLPLLGNMGPRMPIKVFLKGSVISNIKTELKDYGINNVLLKVFVHVETKISVYLPYNSKENKIEIEVPIAMKIIQGGIPQVYGGLFSTSSSIKKS